MDMSSTVWRKALKSSTNGGDCVELATLATGVAVRDSKHPDGTQHRFAAVAFGAFLAEVKRGIHDR